MGLDFPCTMHVICRLGKAELWLAKASNLPAMMTAAITRRPVAI
jgi:hypothetical protein